MKAITLSQFTSPDGLVQREDWASPEPVCCLSHVGHGMGPGLPVLEGSLSVQTEVFRLDPSPETLLSVALHSCAGASLSYSLNSIY